jgi:DnaJ family protein A protein 5
MTHQTRCHYEILSIPRDADAATIKKAHRRLALQHHPDKNVHKSAEEQSESEKEFKLIQAAYECLSDATERKWYDEHREMILRGGVHASADADRSSFIFDVVLYNFAGCYNGFSGPDGFYAVYNMVFNEIFEGEKNGYLSEGGVDFNEMPNAHLGDVQLGDDKSEWSDISAFYGAWESFTSCLSFGWEDVYHLEDLKEAPNRYAQYEIGQLCKHLM